MDTSDRDRAGKMLFMEALLFGQTNGAIEAQEKRGQEEIVNAPSESAYLPREASYMGQDSREIIETFGGEILSVHDDLFYNVRLPDGWKLQATEHSMHSDLLDDKGRKRGGVFYKAAFYDRRAQLTMSCRYGYNYEPVGGWKNYDGSKPGETKWIYFAYDSTNNERLHICDFVKVGPGASKENYWRLQADERQAEKDCVAYLEKNFPDYKNWNAYWAEG